MPAQCRHRSLMPHSVTFGLLGGGRHAQCLGMRTFADLPSVPSQTLASFTDQLRLAVAAYLARFQGSSRYHTESDLRCYLAWCAERGLDPLAARRPHLELVHPVDAGNPPVQALDSVTAFSVTAGFYRTCVIDRPSGTFTRRARPPTLRPTRIADPGVYPPAVRGTPHRRAGVAEPIRLRAGSHARAARLADLRSHRCRHR